MYAFADDQILDFSTYSAQTGATVPDSEPTRVAAVEHAVLDPDTTGSLPPFLRTTFPD